MASFVCLQTIKPWVISIIICTQATATPSKVSKYRMQADSEKFWKLLEPIHPKAESFCRRLAGNRDDGDDLYQEALLAALAKFGTLRDEGAFKPWLYRIAINTHKNRFGRGWWRKHVRLDDLAEEPQSNEDLSSDHSRKRCLQIALSALDTNERALIVLYELEGWSIGELAKLYARPEGTIKARLWRARQKMRKALIPLTPQNDKNKTREDGYELPESKATAE